MSVLGATDIHSANALSELRPERIFGCVHRKSLLVDEARDSPKLAIQTLSEPRSPCCMVLIAA